MKGLGCALGTTLLAAALGWSAAASAGEGFYLGLEGGASFPKDEKFDVYDYDGGLLGTYPDGTNVGKAKLETGWLGGLVAGYGFTSGLRPEFEVMLRKDKWNDGDALQGILFPAVQPAENLHAKQDTTAGFVNLWFDLMKDSAFHPYLGGGAGYGKIDIKNPRYDGSETGYRGADDKMFMWQAGAGLGFDITPNLMLSLDGRWMQSSKGKFDMLANNPNTHLETKYKAASAILGLRFFFGGEPEPAPTEAPPPPEVAVVPPAAVCSDHQDNDGDGKTDFPDDPGCASADDGDETDPPQCSNGKDDDGDGLVDFPADKGCTAADDDDETDPCKAPAPGERVSLKGCGTGDVIVLRGVNFDFDKATLTANARTILDQVAEELNAYPDIKVEVGGHTDAKGSDEYNQKLSERRAASVVKYLATKGVAKDRMTSVGYGESKPVADNETDEGRELNRRVELKVQ